MNQRKKRKCLNCGRMFMSWGPGNRRCERCEKELAVMSRSSVPVVHGKFGLVEDRDKDLIRDLLDGEDF